MLFSTPIFLFLFLPLVLALQFCVGRRLRNLFLVLASLFFYAWGEKQFVLVLLGSILVNYLVAWFIDRTTKCQSNLMQAVFKPDWKAKALLAAGITLNLGLLVVLKYSNFVIDNVNLGFGMLGLDSVHVNSVSIHLPIGISFFTFSAISFLVDLYKQKARFDKNPINTALYIAFFPKLLAGPIVRYHEMAAQMHQREITLDKFAGGMKRLIMGLAKKVLIADTLAVAANQIYSVPSDQLTAGAAWLGVICYTLQIYFDFSGYSDMAIGIGRMSGFDFAENFNYPYISQSIREFWRRWHISLSSWFRDYLYIPLGGNRVSAFRTEVNLLVVFLACGLWHGAARTFVVWGLWHGLFMILERTRFGKLIDKTWLPLRWLYSSLVVIIGWAIFRSSSLPYSVGLVKAMFGMASGNNQVSADFYLNGLVFTALAAGAILSFPVFPALIRYKETFFNQARTSSQALQNLLTATYSVTSLVLYGLLFILSLMSLAGNSFTPFIYFQF